MTQRDKYDLFTQDGKIRESFIRWLAENPTYRGFNQKVYHQIQETGRDNAFKFWQQNYESEYYKTEEDITKRDIIIKNHYYYGRDNFDRMLFNHIFK